MFIRRLDVSLAVVVLTSAASAWAQNPAPFINTLSQTAVQPYAGMDEYLVIQGAGFAPGAVVKFNSLSLIPSSVSSGSITVTIPASSFTTAQTAAVTVVNPNSLPREGTSNTVYFSVGPRDEGPTLRFQAQTPVSVKGTPLAVVTADFNQDGNLDVAAVTCGAAPCAHGSLVILLGDGAAHLQIKTSIPLGATPDALVTGDFDGDGKTDIAVVNQCGSDATCKSPGTVTILHGDGSGGFSLLSTASARYAPTAIVAGDFNGDGYLDLAVANKCGSDKTCGSTGTVSILLGDGSGHFVAGKTFDAASHTQGLAIGDLNRDGKLDLAALNNCGTSPTCDPTVPTNVTVLFGDGSGDFQAASSAIPVGYGSGAIAAGDFNGDGDLDLAVLNACSPPCAAPYSLLATVLLGNGAGKFRSTSSPFPVFQSSISGPYAVGLAVGDFQNNGLLDLEATALGDGLMNFVSGGPALYPEYGPFAVGSPAYPPAYGGSLTLSGLAVGDFNGDGEPDIVTADGALGTVTLNLLNTVGAPLTCGPETVLLLESGLYPYVTPYDSSVVTPIGPTLWYPAPTSFALGNAYFSCANNTISGGLTVTNGSNSVSIQNMFFDAGFDTILADLTYTSATGTTTATGVPVFSVYDNDYDNAEFAISLAPALCASLQHYFGINVTPDVVIGGIFISMGNPY